MQRVLITGANRGLGFELARQCVARGSRVFAGCRKPEQALELQRLVEVSKPLLTIVQMDITDEASLDAARLTIAAQVDALDLLINSAGVNLGDENLRGVKTDILLETLRTNAIGALLVAQRFCDLLEAGTTPKLVNISSEAGSIGRMRRFRGYAYYGSKAALNMYTRSLSMDPNLKGVIVVAMHPGWMRTDMGGSQAPLSPEASAKALLKIIENLQKADSGKFITYTGDEYPW